MNKFLITFWQAFLILGGLVGFISFIFVPGYSDPTLGFISMCAIFAGVIIGNFSFKDTGKPRRQVYAEEMDARRTHPVLGAVPTPYDKARALWIDTGDLSALYDMTLAMDTSFNQAETRIVTNGRVTEIFNSTWQVAHDKQVKAHYYEEGTDLPPRNVYWGAVPTSISTYSAEQIQAMSMSEYIDHRNEIIRSTSACQYCAASDCRGNCPASEMSQLTEKYLRS